MNPYCNLTSYTIIKVSGPNAQDFLQGQLTCDVVNLQAGVHAAHCNPKGRIFYTFRIFEHEDCFYLIVLKEMIDKALERLKFYGQFSQVDISQDDSWQMLGSFDNAPPLPNAMTLKLDGQSSRAFVLSQSKLSIEPEVDESQWQLADIEEGIANITMLSSEVFTPQEINLAAFGGVSLTKGCYLGQEIIARMHYKGKLKKHLYKAQMDAAESLPEVNTTIVNGSQKTVGLVVNSCEGADGKYHLLAVVNDADKNEVYIDQTKLNVK